MTARILVVNAGSSSLKLRVLTGAEVLAGRDLGSVEELDAGVLADLTGPDGPDAIGHRVVHGGQSFRGPVRLDAAVGAALIALSDLAPLHQPPALAAVAVTRAAYPTVPAVACFDTAFHADLPPAAAVYPIPREWRERWALRRYGFHGLSHAYVAHRGPAVAGFSPQRCRTVVCHLGAGASLCAVRDGRSVDTTMGFTPLDGLVMATRCGSLDPGLVLWLQESAGLTEPEIAQALEYRSGLLALGGSADLRTIFAGAAEGDERCVLAADVYVHRLAAGIAAMTAALGGLDVVAYTGGVGENSAELRERVADRLGFLGLGLDRVRNAGVHGDADVTAEGAGARTVVVRAREDLMVAEGVREALGLT